MTRSSARASKVSASSCWLTLKCHGDLLVEFENCYLFSSSPGAQKARVLKVTPFVGALGR